MTPLIRSETEVGWKLNFGDKSLCNAEDNLPHDFCISVFIAAVFVYDALYGKIGADYDYTHFLPALSEITTALSGETPQIAVTVEAIQFCIFPKSGACRPAGCAEAILRHTHLPLTGAMR